ncbi:MAG: Maf family protein [bacterium]
MYILASSSPRRKELLDKTNIEYKIVVKDIKEVFPERGGPGDKIKKVALDKAMAVFSDHPDDIVIGADTGVVICNDILGKPEDDIHAMEMLMRLNANTHSVITGVAIVSKYGVINFYEESKVTFKANKPEEIKKYVFTLEPRGKAGAYAIQGDGKFLVESYTGDLDNIIGLPVARLLEELKKIGG